MKFLFCCFTLSFCLISCKSKALLSPDHTTRIVIGEFGGFAGSYNEIVILPNGQTFKRSKFDGAYTEQAKIDKKMIDQSIKLLERVSKIDTQIQDSGNMSYFIKYEKDGEMIIDALWGGMNQKPSPILKQLHRNLKSLIKEQVHIM